MYRLTVLGCLKNTSWVSILNELLSDLILNADFYGVKKGNLTIEQDMQIGA